MTTNISKSSVSKTKIVKGKEGVTWGDATFAWSEAGDSTWDGIQAVGISNVSKASVTKNKVLKS